MNQLIMLLVLFAALFALAYAALNFVLVRKLKEGNERMQEIAAKVRTPSSGMSTKLSPSSAYASAQCSASSSPGRR